MDVALVHKAQLKAAPHRFRQRYIQAAADAARGPGRDVTVDVSAEDLVIMLEIFSLSALMSEIDHDLGIKTEADIDARADEIWSLFYAKAHIDPEVLFRDGDAMAERLSRAGVEAEPEPEVRLPWEQELRTLSAILEEFPTKELEAAALAAGRPDLAHRARTSHDALRAVLRRNDPAEKAKVKVAGNAYAMGRLSLREVAVMLELSESDAVFELERAGYARSIETIERCADEIEESTLARLAQGVAERGKVAPPADAERVRRDVIASQRIEGIDARRVI